MIFLLFLLFIDCSAKYSINHETKYYKITFSNYETNLTNYLYIVDELDGTSYSMIVNNYYNEITLPSSLYKIYNYSFNNDDNILITEYYSEIDKIILKKDTTIKIRNFAFKEHKYISYKISNNTLCINYQSNYNTFNISSLSLITNSGKIKSYDKKTKNNNIVTVLFYDISSYINSNSSLKINVGFQVERNVDKTFLSNNNLYVTTKRFTNFILENYSE